MKKRIRAATVFVGFLNLGLSVSAQAATPQPSPNGIIFETDFSQDAGYRVTRTGLPDKVNVPTGWDGVKATGNTVIEVLANKGVGNIKPALKILWDPGLGQPTASLLKHLTGDKNTGYDELYIRYNVKLPDNFTAGNGDDRKGKGASLPYWKWGRLWQNTGVNSGWTENRVDSHYIVWNFNGGEVYGVRAGATFGANTGATLNKGSAGGERYSASYKSGRGDYTQKSGHFQAVGNGAWDIDWDVNRTFLKTKATGEKQGWHTIEWRFKLSSSDNAFDGIFQLWFDGLEQPYKAISKRYSHQAPVPKGGGLPTAKKGSGLNFFTLFDNMANWNRSWGQPGVEGGIYVNDVVVSQTRIGHDYVVGGGTNPTPDPAPTYACSDNLDNDRDGLTDYPADTGCTSSTDNDELNGEKGRSR